MEEDGPVNVTGMEEVLRDVRSHKGILGSRCDVCLHREILTFDPTQFKMKYEATRTMDVLCRLEEWWYE